MKPVALRTVDFRGRALTKSEYLRELPRAQLDIETAMTAIEPILSTVANATEKDPIVRIKRVHADQSRVEK